MQNLHAVENDKEAVVPYPPVVILITAMVLCFAGASHADPLIAATESDQAAELPEGLPLDENGLEKYDAGWTFHLDNDLLIPGSDRDQDYTGGLGFTFAGRYAAETWWSLDPLLSATDRLIGFDALTDQHHRLHAIQIGLLVFSPSDIGSDSAIYDDRPFANLLYLSNSRRFIKHRDDPVYQSTFTIGVIGSRIGSEIQQGIHKVVGAETPEGWDHQISDGGELTFQYSVSRQKLLFSNFQEAETEYELKYAMSASLGYISEAWLAVSGRWGYINTPWWSFTPESGDYISQPAPVIGDSVKQNTPERYFWGGIKLRLRQYNALLEGQFRDSEVTYNRSDLERFIAEAWLGITWQFSNYRVSYAARYQTREIEDGAGSRDPIWAGIIFSADY